LAVRNIRKITPVPHWIPPTSSACWKLTVTRKDGTIDDITQIASPIKIEDIITEGIGTFSFEIPNPSGTYTNVWTGDEIVLY